MHLKAWRKLRKSNKPLPVQKIVIFTIIEIGKKSRTSDTIVRTTNTLMRNAAIASGNPYMVHVADVDYILAILRRASNPFISKIISIRNHNRLLR